VTRGAFVYIERDLHIRVEATSDQLVRPWIAMVNGKMIVNKRGRMMRFATKDAALRATNAGPWKGRT
jgi:hypothetical protein